MTLNRENETKIRIDDLYGWNHIIVSSLKNIELNWTEENYSIKYVSQGTEYYKIDNNSKKVVQNSFLITNPTQIMEATIHSEQFTNGLCYFLNPDLINQIRSSLGSSIRQNLEPNISAQKMEFNSSDVNAIDNTSTNSFQTKLYKVLDNSDVANFDKPAISDYLLEAAESLVMHKLDTQVKIQSLKSVKATTRTELFRRLQMGRQYMHDTIGQQFSLKEIGKAALLSEYHFHRCFRAFFRTTPHQYYTEIRMLRAQELLRTGRFNKQEIAYQCGYLDTKYFQRSYRKWLNGNRTS